MKKLSIGLALCAGVAFAGGVHAKLPPPTDAQKAAAAEKAAKGKEAAAKAADLLGKYQDKAVANYKKGRGASASSRASQSGK